MNGKVRKGRKMRKRLIIGMSGASGAPLTIELLKQLQQYKEIIETHLIVTKGAEMTLEQETDYTLEWWSKVTSKSGNGGYTKNNQACLLYTSPSPRDCS